MYVECDTKQLVVADLYHLMQKEVENRPIIINATMQIDWNARILDIQSLYQGFIQKFWLGVGEIKCMLGRGGGGGGGGGSL